MEPPSARGDAPDRAGVTHGFLFADLRGYTNLVDGRGAVAASRLLERYRTLTRDVIARSGGAEIKTEGDSFYVVLPSASAAVTCGLELAAACADPPDGGEPILVGIGIHAGEAISLQGGFVGSAVNIAARVCAEARAGQVLSTATVRELTRSVVDARFVPAGRRTLKGISDPVDLFRLERSGAPPAQRARVLGAPVSLRTRGVGAGLAILVAGALVTVGIVAIGSRPAGVGTAGPTNSGPAGPSSPTASTGSDPGRFPTADEAALLARLPPSISDGCGRGSNPAPVAFVSLSCPRVPGLPYTRLAIRWFRDNPISAGARLDRLAVDRGLPDGDCAGGSVGHGTWGGGSAPRGRVTCFYGDTVFNQAYLYWSYDADGILVEATLSEHNLAGLEAWWKANVQGLVANAARPTPSPSG